MEKNNIEANRDGFVLSELLDARKKTWEAISRIEKAMEIGVSEEEAHKIADQIMKEMGAKKFWHRTHVRFGVNTLKTYSEKSEPNTFLKEDDIYLLDIGPVWNDKYEGDGGATFVVGSDPLKKKCAEDVLKIFNVTREHWKSNHVTGPALYEFSAKVAREFGWELVQEVAGHRLGDFPHHAFFKGSMGDIDFRPAPNAWVLETQIKHSTLPIGAFHEDLLF